MVTIKDGCGCVPCDCEWKEKLKLAYSRAVKSVNKIGDNDGSIYYPDDTGFVKLPLLSKAQAADVAQIKSIKASVDSLNKTVPELETQVTGLTESLVSNVEVLNGTTAGKFKVRVEREQAPSIDSNEFDLSKVNSVELIQGTGPAMVKAQLTLSDGTVLRSDDFVFTSESIGTDVYISSFTFKNGNVDGTISADIGLNNGLTIEANNFVVPTDPNVTTSIEDLRNSLATKADLSNTSQIIRAQQFSGTSGSFNIVYSQQVKFVKSGSNNLTIRQTGDNTNPYEVVETTGSGDVVIGNLAFIDPNGDPVNFTTSGGSTPVSEWETLDLENMPTDFVAGDELEIEFFSYDCYYDTDEPASWTVNPAPFTTTNDISGATVTCKVKLNPSTNYPLSFPISNQFISETVFMAYAADNWNVLENWNSKTYGNVKIVRFNAGGRAIDTITVSSTYPLKRIVNSVKRKRSTA